MFKRSISYFPRYISAARIYSSVPVPVPIARTTVTPFVLNSIISRRGYSSNTNSNIETKVNKIISDQLGVNEDQITNESTFVEDLGADSLDKVELVMAIEEEFDLEIPDAEAEKLTTVKAVVEYIVNNGR